MSVVPLRMCPPVTGCSKRKPSVVIKTSFHFTFVNKFHRKCLRDQGWMSHDICIYPTTSPSNLYLSVTSPDLHSKYFSLSCSLRIRKKTMSVQLMVRNSKCTQIMFKHSRELLWGKGYNMARREEKLEEGAAGVR